MGKLFVPAKRLRWTHAAVLAWLIGMSGCSLRTYDTCRSKSQTLGDLDACMSDNGYAFVSENAAWDPGLAECWDDRYAGTFPMSYCYVQVGPP